MFKINSLLIIVFGFLFLVMINLHPTEKDVRHLRCYVGFVCESLKIHQ